MTGDGHMGQPPGVVTGPRHAVRQAARWGLALTVVLAAAAVLVATTARQSAPPPVATPSGALADGFTVWDRNADGTPVRFDPCSPIEVVLNDRAAPQGARQDLEEALARIAAVFGLDLRLVGTTDEPPSDPRLPYQPERYGHRWAPTLVVWARPGDPGVALRDTDRGIATPVAVGPAGARTYVSGQVLLNADRHDLRAGFGDRRDAWGATLLHEFGHLVGLGHVDDHGELMSALPGRGPVMLGAGDRAGLLAVGASAGCREAPAAGPVRVDRPVDGPVGGPVDGPVDQ